MTHAQLFALIAQVTEWTPYLQAKENFDPLDAKNCKIGYAGDQYTIVLDGHQIAVLDADGREHSFDLSDCVTIG